MQLPDYDPSDDDAKTCWQNMIDAALEVEQRAAALWQKENPGMSVFACDMAMKESYRRRILEGGK